MANSNPIQASIERFVTELEGLIRTAALAAVSTALGAGSASAPAEREASSSPAPRKRGRPPGSSNKAKAPAVAAKSSSESSSSSSKAPEAPKASAAPSKSASKSSKSSVGKRAVGRRRTASEVAATRDLIRDFLKKNPASTMEKLSAGLKLRSPELARPIKELLSGKRITKTGNKRATKYSSN